MTKNNSLLELPDYHVDHRIRRIHLKGMKRVGEKRYLEDDEVEKLLDDEVVIEEKLDGKQVAKVLNDESEGGGNCEPIVFYGEYLKDIHSIRYDKLPSWFVVWDVYYPLTGKYADYDDRLEISKIFGAAVPPLIYRGRIDDVEQLRQFLNRKSSFGDETQEGIVVKNYKNQVWGKIVREEFVAGIELRGHWMIAKGLHPKNQLAMGE